MAVIEVTQMWSKRQAEKSTSDRKTFTKVQSDTYQVTVDVGTTINQILAHADVPKSGSLLSGTNMFVTSVRPQQVSPILWHVPVTWKGETGPEDDDDPLNQPPEITWGDVETEEAIDEDWDGNPIVTANGEPINGITVPIPDQTVTIKRNFATINTYTIGRYRRATNSDSFQGWPPGTARLVKFQAVNKAGDGDAEPGYWQVTATIQFRYPYRTASSRAWYARVRHEGFYVRTVTGDVVRARRDGADTVKPVLLDQNGLETQTPYWLEFKRFDSLPFSSLGLID